MSQNTSTPNPPPGTSFSAQDALEFMQKIWNPFGVQLGAFAKAQGAGDEESPGATPGFAGAMPFAHPAAMFAAIDPEAVGRKIEEMRVIEGWLQMSLNLIQMSIKTLELQKASLEALRGKPAAADPPKAGRGRRKG
jgi:hypothetical protein